MARSIDWHWFKQFLKKKGSKANTKSSANDVSEYHKNGGGRKGGKKMGGKNKRVGKDRRKMNANKRK